jgi:hypothetical protein
LPTSTADHVTTPVNWRPGDKVILPAPPTIEMANERMSDEFARRTDGFESVDWYLCKRSPNACDPTGTGQTSGRTKQTSGARATKAESVA